MLDYAANARTYWPKDKIRALAAEASGGTDQLEIKLQEFLGADEVNGEQIDTEAYWDAVERHLRNGEVRLLFVADHIPTELRRIIEFLNEHMPLVEVLGVEVRQYEGKSVRALVPRVIGQTGFAKQQKPAAARSYRKLTQEEFLARCLPKAAEFFAGLFKQAPFEGYQLSWNPKSFSLRLPMAEGQLVSLFYGWPAAEDGSGVPTFQVYLGYFEDPKEASDLRDKLLSIRDFKEMGEHTLAIHLNEEEAGEMLPMLEGILKLGKQHLSGAE
ncbi:hypothetical protein ABC977_02335 [Thioalkalicoccus limnaeus]|uniref:Uncharacterized protein n=1 Tax=Thioalkalicoccus limnaeus TaxID=120681 RepID=A0ABV4BA07_9GAMM